MNKNLYKLNKTLFFLLAAVLLFTGCSLRELPQISPVGVPSDFLQEKSRLGLVWVSNTPSFMSPSRPGNVITDFYNFSQGITDGAIVRSFHKEIIAKIHEIPAPEILTSFLKDALAKEAKKLGFTVVIGEPVFYPIDWWSSNGFHYGWNHDSYTTTTTDSDGFETITRSNTIPDDFASFAKENNLDKLIVIDCVFIGISRRYATFGIPVGKYKQMTAIKVFVADMKKGGEIIAQKDIAYTEPLTDEVDAPPDFTYVIDTIKGNLNDALDQVYFFVFQKPY